MPKELENAPLDDLAVYRFLNQKEVMELVGISPATLWRWIKSGSFPPPFRIGPNTLRWRSDIFREWANNPEEWKLNNDKKHPY